MNRAILDIARRAIGFTDPIERKPAPISEPKPELAKTPAPITPHEPITSPIAIPDPYDLKMRMIRKDEGIIIRHKDLDDLNKFSNNIDYSDIIKEYKIKEYNGKDYLLSNYYFY